MKENESTRINLQIENLEININMGEKPEEQENLLGGLIETVAPMLAYKLIPIIEEIFSTSNNKPKSTEPGSEQEQNPEKEA